MSTDELQDVALADWHEAVAAAQATGFTFFDWLSAVDRTYDESAPGYDLVLRALDISRQGDGRGIRATNGCGIGSMLSLWVKQRTRETGIRMALGATPRTILTAVMIPGIGAGVCQGS